jgi:hypothetical protein
LNNENKLDLIVLLILRLLFPSTKSNFNTIMKIMKEKKKIEKRSGRKKGGKRVLISLFLFYMFFPL